MWITLSTDLIENTGIIFKVCWVSQCPSRKMSEAEWDSVSLHSKKRDLIKKSEQYNSIKSRAKWESRFLIMFLTSKYCSNYIRGLLFLIKKHPLKILFPYLHTCKIQNYFLPITLIASWHIILTTYLFTDCLFKNSFEMQPAKTRKKCLGFFMFLYNV